MVGTNVGMAVVSMTVSVHVSVAVMVVGIGTITVRIPRCLSQICGPQFQIRFVLQVLLAKFKDIFAVELHTAI